MSATPSAPAEQRTLHVALIGNPNTGKSTLFSALCGVRQRVGNYPGVTVEKKVGRTAVGNRDLMVIDLPGTYSLAPRSPDEMIAVDVLLGRRDDVDETDVILCIVDASNLERNLYLASQVLELERPTVLALNMTDVARERGITLDVDRLRQQLGVPVVPIQANRRRGLAELKDALLTAMEEERTPTVSPFPVAFQQEVAALERHLRDETSPLPRYLVERLLLDTSGYLERARLVPSNGRLHTELQAARGRLAEAGQPVPAVEAMARYQWVAKVLDGVVTRQAERHETGSDRLDRVLTHRIWGTATFFALMVVIFQAVFSWAVPLMDLLDAGMAAVGTWLAGQVPPGALQSLLVDGVVAGVGGVLIFLPQIFILFLFIAVLEDCGYMARAAYLMDKLMSRIGLSGKSFIPLLSSFACAIPGIMAARVIDNRRDRLVTILIAPLMSCSARLPVYVLLIAAFIPPQRYLGGWLGLQGLTMFAMYMLGIVTATVVALVLKRTLLKGGTPPFVMELPAYKVPSPTIVFMRMLERGWAFIRRAGTLIFAVSVVVWAAAYFPRDSAQVEQVYMPQLQQVQSQLEELEATAAGRPQALQAEQARIEQLRDQQARLEDQIAGQYIQNSYLGRLGKLVEPVVEPLGWDWRIGCAVIASFPAREVIIATLGVIYNLGDDEDEESAPLQETLRKAKWHGQDRLVFNVPVALSIMVFFALCAQCVSTLAVMQRETNSWRWPAFAFVYMTVLAYVGAFITYQVGIRLL